MDFGYSLTPSSRIDLDKTDKTLFERLSAMEPDVKKCMACGSCTASCSAGKFAVTSLRQSILNLQNGKIQDALNVLESCMLCGKCTMICPRGINTRNLILSINKIYSNTAIK
jgi:heterodisulfide reductase subunit C